MGRIATTSFLICFTSLIFSQSVDDEFSVDKMRKDLEAFKQIRIQANSGLYKYRTERQIDSIYSWAEKEVTVSKTYLDFYNIICQLTDFEGSTHNSTDLPERHMANLRKEALGYFPYPIKWVSGKWRLNYKGGDIPLGSEIISINQEPIDQVINKVGKYYTTDGFNQTGKRLGIRVYFSRYYRWHYGLIENFEVEYKDPDSDQISSITIAGGSSSAYFDKFNERYSKPYDQAHYNAKKVKYRYEKVGASTGVITIDDFAIGDNAEDPVHKAYVAFLDSVFREIKAERMVNLIVDVRLNTGGILMT